MAVLDLNALLAPIPGADPGGPNPRLVRDKDPFRDPTQLERFRREAVEKGHSLAVNDPARLKFWRDGLKLAHDLFATRSKNLDWAIYVVDTAARSSGFTGAREGFQFLTRLTNEGWEWMWPRVDQAEVGRADPEERESLLKELQENALTARSGRFLSLDDPGSGLLFPNVLREWIIAEADGVAVSVNESRGSDGRAPKVSHEELQAVARKLGPEEVKESLDEIDGALADLESLRTAVEERFVAANAADMAPAFREIRTALEECRQVADELYLAVEGDAEPKGTDAAAEPGESAAASGAAKDRITRASLYKQIAQIADHLSRLEPHSPVPFLLRRVVELQDLPFPELVRQFTHDEKVLMFLERSLAPSSNTGE